MTIIIHGVILDVIGTLSFSSIQELANVAYTAIPTIY
jgi:hypothetical protein